MKNTNKIVTGVNDFATLYPSLEHKWAYHMNEMMGLKSPYEYGLYSHIQAFWTCGIPGHKPYLCSIQTMIRNINKMLKVKKVCCIQCNSALAKYPDIVKYWDYEKNTDTPDKILAGSGSKRWFTCHKEGHESKLIVVADVVKQRAIICDYCMSLEYNRPDLLKEWDYNKNIKKPSEYSLHSGVKVWWHCDNPSHPSYKMRISDKTRSDRQRKCPACTNMNRLITGVNDLQTMYPEIAKRWSDLNDDKPSEVACRSDSYRWFKCEAGLNHPDFKVQIVRITDTRDYTPCPLCKGSGLEQNVRSEIMRIFQLSYADIQIEKKLSCKHNGKSRKIELDVYIPKYKIAFEINGNYWHSDEVLTSRKSNNGFTSAYDYHAFKKNVSMNDYNISLFFIWEKDWHENHDDVITALEYLHENINHVNMNDDNIHIISKLEM